MENVIDQVAKMIFGMSRMENVIDQVAKIIFGMSRSEALEKKICLSCKGDADKKCQSETGKMEYHISGLCEECYDSAVASGNPV